MRITSLGLTLASLLALSACSSLDKLNPFSSSAKKDVPLPTLTVNESVAIQWRAGVGTAGEYTLSPAVIGGSVFAAARDGTLARFDNGAQAWRISAGTVVSGGVGSDGKLVVVGTPKAEVLAFDAATGAALWRARAGSEVLAPPVVAEGVVLVRSGDSRIVALEARDGKRRWIYQRTTPPLSLRSAVGVRLVGDRVLAGFPGGKMVSLNVVTGAVVWEGTVALPKGATELERVTDVTSEPVASGGTVCSIAYQGKLACFEAGNGNALWTRDLASSYGLEMDAKAVFVTDENGLIDALDRASGASLWRQEQLKGRDIGRPVSLGDRLAVADRQGYVHFLRKNDGQLVGRTQLNGSSIRAPLVSDGARVITQSIDGDLVALTVN